MNCYLLNNFTITRVKLIQETKMAEQKNSRKINTTKEYYVNSYNSAKYKQSSAQTVHQKKKTNLSA